MVASDDFNFTPEKIALQVTNFGYLPVNSQGSKLSLKNVLSQISSCNFS